MIKRNLIKIAVLGVIGIVSLNISASYINGILIEVEAQEDSIADIIIQDQVEQAFQEVEKQIEEELEEENIEIETEELEMKPPVVEEEKEDMAEETTEEDENDTGEQTEGEASGEEADDTVEDELKDIIIPDGYKLTAEDVEYLGTYIVDNYFLNGYIYVKNEEDPVLKERKTLTRDMEEYVIDSLKVLIDNLLIQKKINLDTVSAMLTETEGLYDEFEERFREVNTFGVEFEDIYNNTSAYFEQYIGAISAIKLTLETIESTSNKALVLPIIMKSLSEDIMPDIKQTLDAGIKLKDANNLIYLEGLDSSFLLNSDEVLDIIKNPAQILPQFNGEETGTEGEGENSDDETDDEEVDTNEDAEDNTDSEDNSDSEGNVDEEIDEDDKSTEKEEDTVDGKEENTVTENDKEEVDKNNNTSENTEDEKESDESNKGANKEDKSENESDSAGN